MPHIKFPCLLTYWENWGHKGYNVSICSPSLRDLSTQPLILTSPCSTWGMRALVFKFNLLEPASPWPLVGWNSPSPLIYFPMQMKILVFLPLKKKKIPPYPLPSLVTVISYSTFFSHPRCPNTSVYVLPPCPLLPLHWGFPGSWCPQSYLGNCSDRDFNCLPKCCSQGINFSHYPTDLFLESRW